VTDNGHYAFYLQLRLQSIILWLPFLLWLAPVRVTTRVTQAVPAAPATPAEVTSLAWIPEPTIRHVTNTVGGVERRHR
jgi:hypothetical protein